MNRKEKSVGVLALRALVVTVLVLLTLVGLDRLHITSIGEDVPLEVIASSKG